MAKEIWKIYEAFLFPFIDFIFSLEALAGNVVGKWYYSGDGVLRITKYWTPTIFLPASGNLLASHYFYCYGEFGPLHHRWYCMVGIEQPLAFRQEWWAWCRYFCA